MPLSQKTLSGNTLGNKVLVPMQDAARQLLIGFENDRPYYRDLYRIEVCSEFEPAKRRVVIFDTYLDPHLSNFPYDKLNVTVRLQKGNIRNVDSTTLKTAANAVYENSDFFTADDRDALCGDAEDDKKISAFLKLMCCFRDCGSDKRVIRNLVGLNDVMAVVGMPDEYNSDIAEEIKSAGYKVKKIQLNR